MDVMLEEHTKDNEKIRNAIAFELSQMDDEDVPTLDVDFNTASTWMNESEKRRMFFFFFYCAFLGKIFSVRKFCTNLLK